MLTLEDPAAKERLQKLVEWFSLFESSLVAFSAGVDSSLLAYASKHALKDKAIAVTSASQSFGSRELLEAKKIASEIGIRHFVIMQDDLADPNYVANSLNRCYFCRSNLAIGVAELVKEFEIQVCVDGTHLDDSKSPRPGVRALRENGFRAPYIELGFSKTEIRDMAILAGLSNAERPSEACLSSRIAYGQKIDNLTLRMIENAEDTVRELTGAKIVRVRTVGRDAVIELDKESISVGVSLEYEIKEKLKLIGYGEVQISREGFRSGRMLELYLKNQPGQN